MACAAFLFCTVAAIASPAQTLTTLFSFDVTHGENPTSTLVQGTDGNFYGTTTLGGANREGTVFRITPGGTLTNLYNFCSVNPGNLPLCYDGVNPDAELVQGTDGNFYGTTPQGGAACPGSLNFCFGTVFKITPSGTLTTLHSFAGYGDGDSPFAGLIQATDGNFYGTTQGGYSSNGTVFKITPGGTLTTLYHFCSINSPTRCADGSAPTGTLVEGTDGNFYGTTNLGGTSANCPTPVPGAVPGCGTVFKITPAGTLTTLYSFGSAFGIWPIAGLVQGNDGNFYGTTEFLYLSAGIGVGGTVFKITPAGTLTTLDAFDLDSGYSFIMGGLVQATDGNFYGMDYDGGNRADCPNYVGCGMIYKITPAGTLTTLLIFNSTDGAWPEAALIQATDGNLYGTTSAGGTDNFGTVFKFAVGLGPFVETEPTSGTVGTAVVILGTNLTGATSVTFNGTAAAFTVVSSSEITTTVPAGATTGAVQVVTPGGTLTSNTNFVVTQSALATSTALSSVPNPSNLGESVTFTAKVTVTPPGTGTPTGRVTFLDGTTTLGSVALSSSEAVYATSGISAGSHSITAKYSGSTSFLGSTSPVLKQQVNTVTLSPSALNFGTQPVKTTSAAKTVTLTNNLSTALTISSITFTGTDPSDFAQTNTCGTTVAAKGKCTISVKFTPQATGTRTATLNVKDTANNNPQTVTLTGTGELQVAWSPTSLTFAAQPVKTTSAAKTVTLTNNLSTALTISSITFTGTDPSDFAQTNTCGTTVAAKGKCTISVKFTPQATGTRTATLNVKDTANNSPQTVKLTGTGELQVAWSPTSLTFAAQPVKTTSPAKTVTLTNNLSTALTISSITFTGTDPSDFAQTNTCGTTVAAKGKCTISVKFTPQATGTRTATLNVKDTANNSPQTVKLTGTGE
jgi:uncharacterized repeat protein (TIGR03803 family)